MGDRMFTGQDVETLRRQMNDYRRSIEAQLLALKSALAVVDTDTDTTLAMSALEDEVLVADAAGGLEGHAGLVYDEVTLYVPGLDVADDAQIDGSLTVDVDLDVVGDVTCADIDAVGLDVETFAMATGAGANKLLTSDGAGVGTWENPAAVGAAGSDKQVQFNDGGVRAGDAGLTYDKTTDVLMVDHLDMDGTETDELVDIDRGIDANVTKSAVTVTEARSGVVTGGTFAGYDYMDTMDGTVFAAHAGFRSSMKLISGYSGGAHGFSALLDIDGGTVATPAAFYAQIDSELSTASAQLFGGIMALDGASNPTAPVKRAGLGLAVTADSGSLTHGAYTECKNAGTGASYGYLGYGWNTSAGSTMNAVGLYGYAQSANGLEVGLFAKPYTKDASGFAVVAEGHSHFSDGVIYMFVSDAVAVATNKTHVDTTDTGSLYVEDMIEVDGVLYADGGAVVTGDLTVTGELKGGRIQIDAADNVSGFTVSRYLRSNSGMVQNANRGYPQARSGSVVDIAGTCHVNSYSAGAEIHIEVRADGVELGSCDHEIVSTGFKKWSVTGNRGDSTFTADQNLQLYFKIVGTASIGYPIATAGLQLDT